jgi:Na+/H+ antiporter NhaA
VVPWSSSESTLVALVWANSPWPRSYEAFWTTELALSLNDHVLSTDLRGFVNEGLMTLFFLVVGLGVKLALDLGEPRERTRIGIPVVAALCGMALAVVVYLVINAGGGEGTSSDQAHRSCHT